MKKVLFSVIAILLAVGVVGGGAFAQFFDVETVGVHDIQAGTLNLQVGDEDPCTLHITFDDVAPGFYGPDVPGSCFYYVKNTGNLPGNLSVEIKNVVNKENGRTEPEIAAGDVYGDGGELGEYLKLQVGAYQADIGWCNPIDYVILNDISGTYLFSGDVGLLEGGEEGSLEIVPTLPIDTGNIVQSDSVEFDIIFYLDQVTP